jgi:hypothetical protein
MKPLVLDFDQSVKPLAGEVRLDLQGWQERVRFGCPRRTLDELKHTIDDRLFQQPGVAFLGSGDFHHLSYLLIARQARLNRRLQVVVFDNHPDNMRYPFGIHCGSWVWHVSRLPFVSHVHVLGITSKDVESKHAWENHFRNLHSGKVRYWCVGPSLTWMHSLGIDGCQSFACTDAMLSAFDDYLESNANPIYLTIDKDVLCVEDAHTNWDQGVMRLAELESAVSKLRGRVIGADITGEVSSYVYQSWLKRFLSGLDGQTNIETADLVRWQNEHQAINSSLLRCMTA